MKPEYIVVYIVFVLVLACAMEFVDFVIKKIKTKIKAKRIERTEQPVKEDE